MTQKRFSGTIKVKSDFTTLNRIIAKLTEGNGMGVKVGILSKTNARTDSAGESNASVGLQHEFGSYSKNIPQRSFIRMPLKKREKEIIKEIKEKMPQYLLSGIKPFLEKVGMMAERQIGEAFRTGGFGTWQPLSPVTVARKGSSGILIDTGQLQRSITSQVVKGKEQ